MTQNDKVKWKTDRDRHLFSSGPKRILSLDGGGVRGAVTIGFLEKLEKLIEELEGKPTRLCDWFDLIGGTSTGAIIACALTLGHSAAQIHELYNRLAPRVFRHSFWRIPLLQSKFNSQYLAQELNALIRGRKLGSDDIRTGLGVVTKRVDTGSSWVVINNPKSKYWETTESHLGNRDYPLINLVRASAAAPHFFDPEPIQIAPGMEPGLFLDGAVTPHNNPSLQLFLAATLPSYRLSWSLGRDNLTIVSIGTGSYRPRLTYKDLQRIYSINLTIHALSAQISEAQQLILTLMMWLGSPSATPWTINREIGDLSDTPPPYHQALFKFLRYDILLEKDWLQKELGRFVSQKRLASYRQIDVPDNVAALYELGVAAAEKQLKLEHLK